MMSSSVSLLVLVLSTAMILFSCVVIVFIRRGQRKQRLLGIQLLQAGRILLTHFQSHRGLTATFLSGDQSVLEMINHLRADVSRHIALFSDLDEWMRLHDDWSGITQHWARLSAKSFSLSADESFDQHCRLIHSVLALMETVAVKYSLERGSFFEDIRVVWHELLELGELIGQSRALGVRMLRLGNGNPKLRQHKKLILKNLSMVDGLVENSACKSKLTLKDQEEIQRFVCFVKVHLVDNIGPISATEYYHVASEAIALVYENFDREIRALHARIA